MPLFRRRTASRPPLADLDTTLDVDGHVLPLGQALVAARVEGRGLQVIVFHPVFADLPDEPRSKAAHEVLVATLGEDAMRQVVGELLPAVHAPIDPFGLAPLRAFVRSLGVTVAPAEDA